MKNVYIGYSKKENIIGFYFDNKNYRWNDYKSDEEKEYEVQALSMFVKSTIRKDDSCMDKIENVFVSSDEIVKMFNEKISTLSYFKTLGESRKNKLKKLVSKLSVHKYDDTNILNLLKKKDRNYNIITPNEKFKNKKRAY